jgi:hypothetical protein
MNRRAFLIGACLTAAAAPRARAGDGALRLRELYNKDLSFSDYALAAEGQRVSIVGFMAPPLKAESSFFVLTNRPMAVCPFCETEADWPDDILAVYTKRIFEVVPFNVPIVTRGELALGTHSDPETGFVSRVRIVDASFART